MQRRDARAGRPQQVSAGVDGDVGHCVPAAPCAPRRHGAEPGVSYGRDGGDGKGERSCWVFFAHPWLSRGAGSGGMLRRPRCSSPAGPCPIPCPPGEEEGAAGTPSSQPGRASGSEEELCPGGGHYVKWLGLVHSGMDTSSLCRRLARTHTEPWRSCCAIPVVPVSARPGAFCSRLWPGSGPGGWGLICFNVWL